MTMRDEYVSKSSTAIVKIGHSFAGSLGSWTDLRIYDINEKGKNHGILLGTKSWAPTH